MFASGGSSWLARAAYADSSAAPRQEDSGRHFSARRGRRLNVVVPFRRSPLYELRPTIRIPKPGGEPADSANRSETVFFGLHPSLAAAEAHLRRQGAFDRTCRGSPDPTRSHFDAQDYMEARTPGPEGTRDGWLNRALAPHAAPISLAARRGARPSLPRALRGAQSGCSGEYLGDFQVRDSKSSDLFESMYEHSVDTVPEWDGQGDL